MLKAPGLVSGKAGKDAQVSMLCCSPSQFPTTVGEKTSPSPENGGSMFLVRKTAFKKYFYLTNIIVYSNYQLILSHVYTRYCLFCMLKKSHLRLLSNQ